MSDRDRVSQYVSRTVGDRRARAPRYVQRPIARVVYEVTQVTQDGLRARGLRENALDARFGLH